MRTFPPFLLTACLLLAMAGGLPAQDRIPWVTDLRVARQAAEQQQRLVLLHFWSDTCGPCQQLERGVFNQPEFIRVASSGFVPVKINTRESPELAEFYQVTGIPTDVIVDPSGREVFRGTSPKDANAYIAMLDSVRAHHNLGQRVPAGAFASTPRAASQPWEPTGPATAGRDSLPPVPTTSPSTPGNRTEVATRAAANATQPASVENPHSNPLFREQPQQPSAYTPRYGAAAESANPSAGATLAAERPWSAAPPISAPASAPSTDPPAGLSDRLSTTLPALGPTRSGAGLAGSYGASPAGHAALGVEGASNQLPPWNSNPVSGRPADSLPGNPLAGGSLATDPRLAGRAPQPNLPPAAAAAGQPPLALDGFCPVTLVDQSKWAKGDARWGALHRGRVYLFTTQQAQQQFLAQPDRFSPILAGHDAVRFAETGQLVEGRREHGVYYRDRILLFADEDALQRFGMRPDFYVTAAEQASLARAAATP